MSTLLMRPPKETRLLAREGKLHLSAVDPQDRLARISHRTNKTLQVRGTTGLPPGGGKSGVP